jgi:hypothetical protein
MGLAFGAVFFKIFKKWLDLPKIGNSGRFFCLTSPLRYVKTIALFFNEDIDGDFYERLKSVLPNFSGEAKNLITSMRIIWESWNRQIYFFL